MFKYQVLAISCKSFFSYIYTSHWCGIREWISYHYCLRIEMQGNVHFKQDINDSMLILDLTKW